MPRPLDQLLQIHLARPEASLRLAARRRKRRRKLLRPSPPHACPSRRRPPQPSASPDSQSPRQRAPPPQHPPVRARYPEPAASPPHPPPAAPGLRPQYSHRTRRRPDKCHPHRRTSLRELRILRQKPISRMHRIGPRPPRNLQDQIPPQIALRRRRRPQPVRLIRMQHMQRPPVRIRVHRHRGHPHLAASANHSQRNLTAIRNQHFFYRSSQAAILSQPPAQLARNERGR